VLDMLLPEPGAFYVMDRAYLDFARLHRLDQAGSFFVTRAKRTWMRATLLAPADRSSGMICDQTISLAERLHPPGITRPTCAASAIKDPDTGKGWCS
jgi:hypothetical protein